MRLPAPLFAIAALAPLAGCVSFGPKPPASLMTLTASSPLTAGAARTTDDKHAVSIALLSVPPALATQRVMVADGPVAVAYIKGALWAAQPAMLFRGLLAETITVRTGRVVPDQRQLTTTPDTRLSGQLSECGLDAQARAVIVTFDAAISRSGSETLETRRFQTRVPVSGATEAAVAPALNQAANQVASDVADWIGR